MPGDFKGIEKKFRSTAFFVVIIRIFSRHRRRFAVSRARKMEYLHGFGVRHHGQKFWGRNHEFYKSLEGHFNLQISQRLGFCGSAHENECYSHSQYFKLVCWTSKHCPIQSPTSHFRQYIVTHFFTVFPVWRLFLSAHTRHEHWDIPFSLACVTGILYKKFSLPMSLPAGLLVRPCTWDSVPALASNPSATFS
jgi:hypothetical protein